MTIRVFCILLLTCLGCHQNSSKIIDTGYFEITVPIDWIYQKEQGIDSFVGRINGDGVSLTVDWSEMGYADNLIPTEKEYVYESDWEWIPTPAPYLKPGVTYTTGDVKALREEIIQEKGLKDSSSVKVEPIQLPTKKIQMLHGKYSAELTYQDTIINVIVEIPVQIRKHSIQIDTIDHYERKLIYPRSGENGIIGVYFEDLNSQFNFNISGVIDEPDKQQRAIEAFKTIDIKRN